MTQPIGDLPPIKLAFVIDGQVVDVLHTDDRLAAIFLSDPLIIDVTAVDTAGESLTGWLYDGTTFSKPSEAAN